MRHAKLRVSFNHLTEVLGMPKGTKLLDVQPLTQCVGGWVDLHVAGPEFHDCPIGEPTIIEWPIKPGQRPED